MEVRFTVAEADWIPDRVKRRLLEQRKKEVTKNGEFVVTCSEQRVQSQNLDGAIRKLQSYIDEACAPPPAVRIPTKTPQWAIEQRIKEKKQHSDVKKMRRKPIDRDD